MAQGKLKEEANNTRILMSLGTKHMAPGHSLLITKIDWLRYRWCKSAGNGVEQMACRVDDIAPRQESILYRA